MLEIARTTQKHRNTFFHLGGISVSFSLLSGRFLRVVLLPCHGVMGRRCLGVRQAAVRCQGRPSPRDDAEWMAPRRSTSYHTVAESRRRLRRYRTI